MLSNDRQKRHNGNPLASSQRNRCFTLLIQRRKKCAQEGLGRYAIERRMKGSQRKLSADECDKIANEIARLEKGEANYSFQDLERILAGVLRPLLQTEGFELSREGDAGARDYGLDFRGTRGDAKAGTLEQVGIEAKFYRKTRTVPLQQVHALIGAALSQNIDRVILVSNREFSAQARESVARSLPISIELQTLQDLRNWLERLREDEPSTEVEVRMILRALSEQLARLIARDPGTLAHLEWRDVERVIAEVFDGLGFKVELTPGTKDGGKDVVVQCEVAGTLSTYYVEIKHWRSSTRVGPGAVEKLLKVIVREKKAGGLFLSTYGFTDNAFEQLTAIDKQRLKFGDQEKVVTLCRTYVRAKAGIWSPPENLTEVLFD